MNIRDIEIEHLVPSRFSIAPVSTDDAQPAGKVMVAGLNALALLYGLFRRRSVRFGPRVGHRKG
jgi:hypothetical protein